jgi:hypothetical protein
MRFLSPPTTLYYSIQLDDGQTTERDNIVEAEIAYVEWCKKYPDRKVKLVHILAATVYENEPVKEPVS